MSKEYSQYDGKCSCGNAKFTIKGAPLLRVVCHCTICQEYKNAAFSDVTVFRSKDVELHDSDTVSFKTYMSPSGIQRGKCVSCNNPIIEIINTPIFFPSLIEIPSELIPPEYAIEQPSDHTFYHSRVKDIDDGIPKISGAVKSELILGAKVLRSIFSHKKCKTN